MLNKFLEKKVQIVENEDAMGYRSPIELEYYLLESEVHDLDEMNGKKAYGIEVIKKAQDKDMEIHTIKNFSCCKENTREVLDKLATHTVTPVAMSSIIDDILGM